MYRSMHVSAWAGLEDDTPIEFLGTDAGEVELTLGARDGVTITATRKGLARLAQAVEAAQSGDQHGRY